ncbi:glycosyltransferase [Flavobacterium sp.]|uniref:glycosyltransferase n=1 Tax=Flavobacterium sp. TaxID=239 RepID=UPI0040474F7D
MDEIKKIALVIPSLHPGGMERVMSELIDEFSKDNSLELHLILYGISRDVFYSIPSNLIIHKPEFVFNNKYRFIHTIRTLFFLRKQIIKIQPTTVLSFGEMWNNFVLLACYSLKYPVFVSDRCQPNKTLGKLHDWLRIKLYPNAKGVIAQTQNAKEIFEKLNINNNVKVIGNPIRQIQSNNNIVKENIVLSVGRLIDTKHHDDLIRMFVEINQPNWKLVIVGDDAIKQQNKVKLELLIKELNAVDRVFLAGSQKDVEAFYLKSKIFAFTSSSEGFPNVIGEAMSAGLPVIAFDCVSGPSDMITNDENGLLIDLFDYATFTTKLNLLISNEELRYRLGGAASKSIQKFSKTEIAEKYKEMILNK